MTDSHHRHIALVNRRSLRLLLSTAAFDYLGGFVRIYMGVQAPLSHSYMALRSRSLVTTSITKVLNRNLSCSYSCSYVCMVSVKEMHRRDERDVPTPDRYCNHRSFISNLRTLNSNRNPIAHSGLKWKQLYHWQVTVIAQCVMNTSTISSSWLLTPATTNVAFLG
jgi:hypothetical protein